MYVIPVAYYVVKPDGGLQQSGPRIEVVGNSATLRQNNQGYYFDQQQQQGNTMYPGRSQQYPQRYYQQQQHPYYQQQSYHPQQGGWSGGNYNTAMVPAHGNSQFFPQQQNGGQSQYYGSQPGYFQQPASTGGNMLMPTSGHPRGQQQQQQHNSQPSINMPGRSQQQQRLQQIPMSNTTGRLASAGGPPPISPARVSTAPNSRSGSLERQRKSGGMVVEIPSAAAIQPGPLSTGSLPTSPRHRNEVREAMEQPVSLHSPPPRQLFELPWDEKTDPQPQQNIRHVRPQELVPPEVIAMYSGKRGQQHPHHHSQQGTMDNAKSGPAAVPSDHQQPQQNISRSSSLRRSQQQRYYDDIHRRKLEQQQQANNADLAKTHYGLANSREHLGTPKRQHRQQHQQHYAEPIKSHQNQPGAGQETVQLVRHVPPEEAAQMPNCLFEEKPKWQPMRPDKFSIFGKEAAYPPVPVIGPRYMISVSGGAKLIEIILSVMVLVLVTIICDRGRCFPRTYNPMATEVTMWIVAGCCIVGTVFMCVPYARKQPLSPKAYYRFLLVEVVLNMLGALSYFVASICLLVIKEGEIIGYLIETWVCAAALGFVCGVLYVCSTVFAWLAMQRAKYYLQFLYYASHRHKDATKTSLRMSVQPTVPSNNGTAQSNRHSYHPSVAAHNNGQAQLPVNFPSSQYHH